MAAKGNGEHGAPILVIKKKKRGEGEEHSAAWKIAYADFMTAMMAFFLVMWLTSNMSQDSKKGISHYFDPIGMTQGASGVGGVLGGKTITVDGPLSEMQATTKINPPLGSETDEESDIGPYKPPEDIAREAEKEAFEALEKKLQEMIQKEPDLQDLADFVHVHIIEEGIRIDLVENYQKPMFALGSSTLTSEAQKLLDVVSESLEDLANKIHIVGHTDALQYKGSHFTNWELSINRASETRRYLMSKIASLQVKAVTGKADKELYVPEHPDSPLNRRISIFVFSNFEQKGHSLKTEAEEPQAPSEQSKTVEAPSQEKPVPEILQVQEIH